jgi:phage tail-like protein
MTEIPLTGFSFIVEFGLLPQMPVDTQFQIVSGLNIAAEIERAAGSRIIDQSVPDKSTISITYSELVLKRGLPKVSVVSAWCIDAFENNNFKPVNLKIILWDAQQNPVSTWHVSHAIPVKRELSDFNAMESNIVIETITLHYTAFKTMNDSTDLIAKKVIKVIPDF